MSIIIILMPFIKHIYNGKPHFETSSALNKSPYSTPSESFFGSIAEKQKCDSVKVSKFSQAGLVI